MLISTSIYVFLNDCNAGNPTTVSQENIKLPKNSEI